MGNYSKKKCNSMKAVPCFVKFSSAGMQCIYIYCDSDNKESLRVSLLS